MQRLPRARNVIWGAVFNLQALADQPANGFRTRRLMAVHRCPQRSIASLKS